MFLTNLADLYKVPRTHTHTYFRLIQTILQINVIEPERPDVRFFSRTINFLVFFFQNNKFSCSFFYSISWIDWSGLKYYLILWILAIFMIKMHYFLHCEVLTKSKVNLVLITLPSLLKVKLFFLKFLIAKFILFWYIFKVILYAEG